MKTYRDFLLTTESMFSDDHRYRYWLRECLEGIVLSAPIRPVVFLMLNPSMAGKPDGKGGLTGDPTVRRCSGYARAWGYTDRIVVNMFSLVSTDPAGLFADPDPIGPDNDLVIAGIQKDWPVVCAWGAHSMVAKRVGRVVALLNRPLLCLATTTDGSPGHPLYLKKDLLPVPWTPRDGLYEGAA
jgi:hypothetical protein